MRELPTKTTGTVSIRALNGAQAPNSHASRTTAMAGAAVADPASRRAPLKLLRFPEVRQLTGLSRSTVWRLEGRGEFPRHHRIAPNVVAWLEDDVANWIRLRTEAVAS